MEINEIWLSYVNEHMDPKADVNSAVEFRASDTLELFFELHPMFTKRWDAISATPFSSEFDETANGALANLAIDDNFGSWELLPAGAWRVLSDRLQYCELALTKTMAQGDPVIDYLPQGLGSDQQAKALFLKYLLGHGRTIDRGMLGVNTTETLQEFPAQQILRPQ